MKRDFPISFRSERRDGRGFPHGRRPAFFLPALLFLLALFPVSASADPADREADTDETVLISRIRINGVKDVKTDRIKEAMITPFPSRKPWKKLPEFNEQFFEDDIKRIEQVLREHGYYRAAVTYDLDFRNGGRKVNIEITVDQGEPVVVKTLGVSVLGHHLEDYASEVAERVLLEEGKPFSQIKYQKSKVLIAEMFSDRGYPLAEVISEATVNLRRKEVRIQFTVDPGREYYFGEVMFQGNPGIATGLLEREMEYEKGDLFSFSKTQKSRANIFGTGLFSSVIVDSEYDEENFEVRTRYSVSERKLGTIKLGAGYATEDRFRAQLSWTQKNFLDGGRTLRVVSSYSSLKRGLLAQLTQPHVIGRNSSLAFLADVKRSDLPSYRGLSFDFKTTLTKRVFDDLTVFSSVDLVYADLESQVARTPIQHARDNVFLTLIDVGVDYDLTDSLINPTRGMRLFLFMEKPVQFLSSDRTHYLKSFGELRYYRTVSGVVLGKRFTVGSIIPLGDTNRFDVPVFERFFAGGSASMRGYSFQRLGPLSPDRDPLGGNSMIVGNAEARFGIFGKLGGVVFLDYGNVFEGSFDFSASGLRYAAGGGLRYDTAVGPIRADFGYLLNPGSGDSDRFKIFISIGQAF